MTSRMRKNARCSKFILRESWGSKFCFGTAETACSPIPESQGETSRLVYTLTTITTLENAT